MKQIKENFSISQQEVNKLYGVQKKSIQNIPNIKNSTTKQEQDNLINLFCTDNKNNNGNEYFLQKSDKNLMQSQHITGLLYQNKEQELATSNINKNHINNDDPNQVYKINIDKIDEEIDYDEEAYKLDQEIQASKKIQELLNKSSANQQQFKFQNILEKQKEKKALFDNCNNNLLRSLCFCDIGYKINSTKLGENQRIFHLADEFLFYYTYIPKDFTANNLMLLEKCPKAGVNLLDNLICKYDNEKKILTITFQSHLMLDFKNYKLMDNPALFIDEFRETQQEFQEQKLSQSKLINWQVSDLGTSNRMGFRIMQYYEKVKLIKQQEKKVLHSQFIPLENKSQQIDQVKRELEANETILASQKQQSMLFSTIIKQKKSQMESVQVKNYVDTSVSQVKDNRSKIEKKLTKRKPLTQYALKILLNQTQKKLQNNIGHIGYQVLPHNSNINYSLHYASKQFYSVFSFLGFKVAIYDQDPNDNQYDNINQHISNIQMNKQQNNYNDIQNFQHINNNNYNNNNNNNNNQNFDNYNKNSNNNIRDINLQQDIKLLNEEGILINKINQQEIVFMDSQQLKEKIKEICSDMLSFIDRNYKRITEQYVKQQLIYLMVIKYLKRRYKQHMRAQILGNEELLKDTQQLQYAIASFMNSVFGNGPESEQTRQDVVRHILSRYGRVISSQEIQYQNRTVMQYLCLSLNIELEQKVKVGQEDNPVSSADILSVHPKVLVSRNIATYLDSSRDAKQTYQFSTAKIKKCISQGVEGQEDLQKVYLLKKKLRFTILKIQLDIFLINYYVSQMDQPNTFKYQIKLQHKIQLYYGYNNPINLNFYFLMSKFNFNLQNYQDSIYFAKQALQQLDKQDIIIYQKKLELLMIVVQIYQLIDNNKQYQKFLQQYDQNYDDFIQYYDENPNQIILMQIFKIQEQRKNLLPSL